MHSNSLLMLADAPYSTTDINASRDSYAFDKTLDDSMITSFQNMHLSPERHMVPCSSCCMFLDMPHNHYLQTFPKQDLTSFICPQCLLKGELITKIEELEALVSELQAEKRQSEILDMENSFDRFIDSMNLTRSNQPCNQTLPDPTIYLNHDESPENAISPNGQVQQDSIITVLAKEKDVLLDQSQENILVTNRITTKQSPIENLPLITNQITDSAKTTYNNDLDVSVLLVGDSIIHDLNIVNTQQKKTLLQSCKT